MRKLLHILLFISLPFIAISQNIKGDNLKIKEKSRLIGQVTIGSKTFDNSAILTLTATDRGLLIPRLTTAERDAIGSPSTGLLIFNTTTNQFEFFETTWQAIGEGGDMIGANNLSDVSNATTSYNNIKQQGTTTFIGAWESGTVSEINTGTDVTKLVTVDGLAGSQLKTDVTTNNAKVTNATHTGDVTGSGVLTIAAKSVEISMLDDGTDGELITWDASGVAATVAVGTSGQILTSNGAGAAPTFQAGGGGNTIYTVNDNLTSNRTVTMGAFGLSFSGNLTTFKGINAAGNFSILATDNSNVATFRVGNDGVNYLSGITNGHTEISRGVGVKVFNASGVEQARLTLSGALELRNSSSVIVHNLNTGTNSQLQNNNVNLGIGKDAGSPTARLFVTGTNATSANFGLKVQNNAGTDLFVVRNDGNVGIGTSSPATSAILDITTTTGALLFPRMTTAQRDALTVVNGMVVYNSSLDKLQVRAGGSWISLH